MLTVYHGGHLDENRRTRLWTSTTYEYATWYADSHETNVWALTLDLEENEILDVTAYGSMQEQSQPPCGRGTPGTSVTDDQHQDPQCALRHVPDDQIQGGRLSRGKTLRVDRLGPSCLHRPTDSSHRVFMRHRSERNCESRKFRTVVR